MYSAGHANVYNVNTCAYCVCVRNAFHLFDTEWFIMCVCNATRACFGQEDGTFQYLNLRLESKIWCSVQTEIGRDFCVSQ